MPDSRKSLKSAFSYKAIILVLANHHLTTLPGRHTPHLKQPARNRHPCPSALLSVAPVPTFQKSRKTHLSPFPTKLAWPHGHFSCKLRILGSEALATETQKPQTSQGLLDHGLLPVIKGVGPRHTDLAHFVYRSHLMHGLWSLPESAFALALASKSAPFPYSFVKRKLKI